MCTISLPLFTVMLIALTPAYGASTGHKVPAVIVFGDSSVDSGNNNFISTIAKCNFLPYGRDFPGGSPTGRFSNGLLSPDFLSQAFGLKPTVPAYLDPSYNISEFATGVCFASAGTGYDNATSDVLGVIPLWKELEYYKDYQKKLKAHLGSKRANQVISKAVYIMSIGTNDFLENYYTNNGRRSQFNIEQYQDFLIGIADNFVRQLFSLGARRLSLTGLPPMGCLPLERATNFMDSFNCMEQYNDLALEFNGKLSGMIQKLNRELPGMKVVFANPYYILLDLITKPTEHGFDNAEEGCCGTGTFEMGIFCSADNPFTCPDANKYVFWDAFHPSQRTNQIIASYVFHDLKASFL